MPVPAALAGALAPLLGQLFRWIFIAKLAGWLAKVAGLFGIALATEEYLVEPLIEQVTMIWQGLPADVAQWLTALQIDKVASIVMSAISIAGVKQIMFTRTN